MFKTYKMKTKRVSKRNKIAWRKHVNIDDVEDYLETVRFEEKFGLHVHTEEAFTEDIEDKTDVLSKRERIKLKLENPRCFSILKPHTNVPDPIVKRNRVRSKEERRNNLVKLKEEERKAKGIFKAKEIDSIKGKQFYERSKLKKPKRGEFNTDLWNVTEVQSPDDEWVREDAVVHNLRQTGAYVYKVSPTIQQKTSVLPTVEPPHPGTSYNPSFEDHQDLLKEIAEKEQELIKRDQHLNRVTRNILKKVPLGKNEKSWLEEMSQGLPIDSSKQNEEEDVISDTEYQAINPPVKNKKKTIKQRKTQKRLLLEDRLRKLAKIEKRKIVQLNSLKALAKYVTKREDQIAINKEKREEYVKSQEKLPKRLGFHKYEENDLEFNMPSEIAGTLRGIKKQSNLLVDRFNNLQKRNLIAPSVRVQAKRAKTKRFVKPGHADNWKKTVAGLAS